MPLVPDPKNCDISVKRAIQGLSNKLGYTSHVTHATLTLDHTGIGNQLTLSKVCTAAAGLSVLRVTGLQTDDTALTGTLRGGYIDVSNGSTVATGTIRALELKARTEAPGDTGNNVAVLEGLSISADSKAHNVTTMRAAEFILDGKTAGTIDEAVGLRIANNLQVDKATTSYGLQIYRDSFDYTYDISLSLGGHITGDSYVNQDVRTTASPTYAGLTLSGLTASKLIGTNASKALESVTVGTGLDYTRPNLTLSHLGIQDLSDAGADKIMFWDDDQDACGWLTPNTLISITGTNLNVDNDLHNFSWTNVDATDLKTGSITQAYDAGLLSLAGLTYIAASFIKMTGANTFALRTIGETADDLQGTIDHDLTANYDANKHIDHIGVTLTAGTGLTGGGDISSNRTFAVDGVLEDLDTLGANSTDSEFLVGTDTGALTWESGTTVRTSIGLGTGDSPTFAACSLGTGELTCGSINRATGTLTLEIGGTAELSITSTATTFGGNLIIPDGGTIGQAAGPLLTFDDTNDYLEITGCNVGIGTATPESLIHSVAQGNNIATIEAYTGTAAIIGKTARGTIAEPTSVVAGIGLFTFGGRGYGATAFSTYTKATISFMTAENWTDSEQGTYIDFETTAIGGTTRSIKMQLLDDGGLKLNSLKSGATQAAAGAAANELWVTNGHASQEDNTIMIGV